MSDLLGPLLVTPYLREQNIRSWCSVVAKRGADKPDNADGLECYSMQGVDVGHRGYFRGHSYHLIRRHYCAFVSHRSLLEYAP